MSQAVRIRLVHALLALLLSAGLLLPLLGALEPSFLSPAALVPAVLTILFFEACCISRRTAVAGSVLAAAAVVFWLFSAGGLASLGALVGKLPGGRMEIAVSPRFVVKLLLPKEVPDGLQSVDRG